MTDKITELGQKIIETYYRFFLWFYGNDTVNKFKIRGRNEKTSSPYLKCDTP
mgnify:CR=1 FL=1